MTNSLSTLVGLLTEVIPQNISPRDETIGCNTAPFTNQTNLANKIVIIGIPDDRGVANNKGHLGAAQGPHAFRNAFYKLYDTTIDGKKISECIVDVGDITLTPSIDSTHERLTAAMTTIMVKNPSMVFVIGGGHDFSYASYKAHTLATSSNIIPIVNLDAHFDLRQLNADGAINSGTPFFRIIETVSKHIANGQALCELGIQRDRNPSSLFDYANAHGVTTIEMGSQTNAWINSRTGEVSSPIQHVYAHLDACTKLGWHPEKGSLHLSLDLDVFSSDLAMGTSAATPFGARLDELWPVLAYFAEHSVCKVVDVAELCPARDSNDQTSRLAAGLVYRMIAKRLQLDADA